MGNETKKDALNLHGRVLERREQGREKKKEKRERGRKNKHA